MGGGHLEWQAIALARQTLAERATSPATSTPWVRWSQTFALGPTLGQCCGGVMVLGFEPLSDQALSQWPTKAPRFHLELHGAGHVGQAIIRLLTDIDCTVRWIDQRLDDQPASGESVGLPSEGELSQLPSHIRWLATDEAASEVPEAPAGSTHLVLTHRHDLDLSIMNAILRRPDVLDGRAWVGLIGSNTKRAAFEHRLEAKGHEASAVALITCPIGLPGITGKEPSVIAIAVVAQLLQRHL